ncbi:MAG: hypothetical protein LBQ15_10695 [Clostridium sp.]|jgi:signal transduction histidine kinase|nr:hypothetical protein [Clostridium sp.]
MTRHQTLPTGTRFPAFKVHRIALLILCIATYTCTLFFFILYLCQDALHLGIFLNYFPIPEIFISDLREIPISKESVLRLLNVFCLAFLMSNLRFSFRCFFPRRYLRTVRGITIFGGVFFGLQALLYDPYLYRSWYRLVYPAVISSARIHDFYVLLQRVTYFLNNSFLGICLIPPLFAFFSLPRMLLLRLNMVLVFISYTFLLVSYAVFFHHLPRLLVKYSRVADWISFRSLVLTIRLDYYRYLLKLFPFLLFLLALSFFFFLWNRKKVERLNLDVVKNIRAVNVSSSLFCHYMKNEILAISAQVEELSSSGKGNTELTQEILNRCEKIYAKLDGIHKSMRDNTMFLKHSSLKEAVENAAASLRAMRRMDDITLELHFPSQPVFAMIDRLHFEQALLEILLNGVDAMRESAEKRLTVKVYYHLQWVIVSVSDTGCGIEKEHLRNIFTPLYTSKRISSHWGIGLTMAHKIMTSFEGHIQVHSRPGNGTTFEILLPMA